MAVLSADRISVGYYDSLVIDGLQVTIPEKK